MKLKQRIGLTVALLVSVGCSNQWREGDSKVTSTQLESYFAEMQQASGQSVGDSAISEAMDLKGQDGTFIFFNEGIARDPKWPLAGAIAFDDLTPIMGSHPGPIQGVRVFFLDGRANGVRRNVLIVGIATAGGAAAAVADPNTGAMTSTSGSSGYQYFGFTGNGSVADEEFSVQMSSSNGGNDIILRSDDVDGEDFNQVIQLRAYQVDSDGNEAYIGKFSTLVGVSE